MKRLYTLITVSILFSIVIISKVQAACNITVTLSSTSATVNVGASTGTITATAHNNVGVVTYGWAPCSTLNSSTGASVIATPLGSTTYTVTAFDANGCTATATVTVNVVNPSIPGSGGASTVAAAYTYSYSTGGGVFNSMAGATVLATNSGMTNTNYNIDLSGLSPAFNFVFPGGTFNQFGVNTNGYVFLGAAATATDNQPIASTDPCTGIISGWGVALQGRAGTGGSNSNIEYVVSGASPNRTLTIQWTDVQFQSRGSSASQYFNMQIILYEADYHIDFIYSDQFSQFISGQVGNVQIGLRGATNADFLDRTGDGGGGFGWDPSQTSAGVNNTDGVAFVGGFAASYIQDNDRITYTPSCIGTRTTITPSGTTDLCPGGSVDLMASSGTSYTWYVNGVLDTTTSQTYSGITTAGTYAVLASPSVGCGIPSYVISVTTNATVTPSVSITSNPTPLCGASATFTATPTNGGCVPTYQWQLNGIPVTNIALNKAIYTNNALNPNDQVQVIMTTDALCASPATATSNVLTNSLPAVAPVLGGASSICLNASTSAFTDATAGGSWSITSGTGTASITTGGVVTGLTAGTVTVIYTYTGGACSNTASAPLTINPLPVVASITGTQSVCVNSTTQLSNTTTGGTWSSGTPSVATVDANGLVTGISADTSVITYTTAANGNGCSNSTNITVTVNALPTVASITGTLGICGASTTQLNDVTTGGTWSSGNASVATVDASGLVTGISPGSSVITYTTATDGNGCSNATTATVTVNALPSVASITGLLSVCNNSTTQLSDATGGGTWSTGTPSVATVNASSGLVTGVSADTSVITYTTAPDDNGCTNSTTATVTVNPLPVVTGISGTLSVCANSTIQLSDATTGGTWSNGTTSIATIDTSGLVTGVSAGNSTITYTTAADSNGCTNSATATFTVNALPSLAPITGTLSACINSSTQLRDVTTGGTWSSNDTSVATVNASGLVAGVSAGSSVITYTTAADGNGCISSASDSVIVNQTPLAGASGDGPVCTGSELDLSSSGGISYSWTGPDNFTSSQQDPIIFNALPSDSGTFIVTVTGANGGCTATASYSVIVFPSIPTPTIIQTGDTLTCSSDPTYTSYQWYADTTLIAGATDSSLIISKSGNYNIQVGNQNGCKVAVGINVTLTGIPILSSSGSDDMISLFPNPVSNMLSVYALFPHANDAVTISVMNLLGEVVQMPLQASQNEKEYTLNLENLGAGLYFLQVKSASGSVIKRFIKE